MLKEPPLQLLATSRKTCQGKNKKDGRRHDRKDHPKVTKTDTDEPGRQKHQFLPASDWLHSLYCGGLQSKNKAGFTERLHILMIVLKKGI
jgi:hypothetical protein